MVFLSHTFAAKFYSINSIYGISIRETNSVCRDNNGFIWASSKTGILRLTKDNYRIYRLSYEINNVVTVKLVYQNSKLIAYTDNGQVFLYNPVQDEFELQLNLRKLLKDNNLLLKGLLIDDKGAYWLALSTGLYKYELGKLSFGFETLSDRYSITWYDKQNMIIAIKGGIWLFNINTNKSECIYKNSSIVPFRVSSLFFDKTQYKLWIGTISNGIYCLDFKSKAFSNVLKSEFPSQPVLAIGENSDSTILFGFDGQGVWEINKQGSKVLNVYKESADDPYSLRGNGVYDLFCDNNRRVWICTFSGGLSFYDQGSNVLTRVLHNMNNANSLINNEVNSILEDKYGKIWFATNNGISCWNILTNQWKSFYSNKLEQAQVFMTLCEDDKDRIWAGTYSSGVYILDVKTGKELAHYTRNEKNSLLISNFVIRIFKDRQGDIWIGGSSDELICYLSKEDKFRTYSKEPISSFADISSNQILLGCTYGLSQLNKQTGEIKRLLMGYVVQDILQTGDEIWICTSGNGLFIYNLKTGKTENFTRQSGLPSNYVNSILYANNYFWLGTENGLCRFNPKDKSVFNYSSITQLSSLSYNRSSRVKLRNGTIAWGTNTGAVIFAPDSISEIPSEGKLYLQDLRISGKSIREIPDFKLNTPIDSLKEISLKYTQNNISLELVPIGTPPGTNLSWKLEGFDNNWTSPANNRILTYTNIPSGKFTLKIKLYNSSLSEIIAERHLTIKVIPPFWRTGWFWILVILVLLGIILLYVLYYINTLKQKHSIEKIRFFTNTAHDIRNSLTLIKAPVEELKREMNLTESGRYFLSLAIEQARRLSTVVTQLLDFQKVDIGKEQMVLIMRDIVKLISNRIIMFESFSKSKEIDLIFTSDIKNYKTAIDEVKIEKVIDNLVSNAVKYSNPGSQVYIELKCGSEKWTLSVKDNGIGISKKAQRMLFKEFHRGENVINSRIVGSGIGLLLVKNYVSMHGGKIKCSSQENSGSTFIIEIPYKELSIETIKENSSSETSENTKESSGDNIYAIDNQGIEFAKEMTVLIVEDNEDLLDFMRNTLIREFNLITAENGKVAWELILEKLPDLIVSDVMMPEMDGFELCKLIKSTYETSHIPIILLTGLSEKAEELHGLGLGADDYLIKPFDTDLLVQRINTIIRNRGVLREKALKLIGGNATEPLLENEHNDKFVKKMLEVAKANISNSEFNKELFAAAMNVSSSLLYKKMKSLTDQSPTDFIKIIRLDHSMKLLQTRKYNITEVSELCGFTSVAYFSTVFKKYFGKSPAKMLE
jgi:signal transduction histidine kinase/DNA-binding response OmpR family regulator/ligand-binding sensor domain-containing protein